MKERCCGGACVRATELEGGMGRRAGGERDGEWHEGGRKGGKQGNRETGREGERDVSNARHDRRERCAFDSIGP